MSKTDAVEAHYTHGALLQTILDGVERMGKSPDTVTVEDLGPVDEFHIGGRVATRRFLDQLGLVADDRVLDVGCGPGRRKPIRGRAVRVSSCRYRSDR